MKEEEHQLFRILKVWGKKKGLFLSSVLIIGIYYTFLKPILKDDYYNAFDKNDLNLYIPLVLLFILFCIWVITSNRISFFRSGELRIGIFFNLDDESYEDNLKKISNNIIDELKEEHKNIKIILYPINFKKSKENIKKYIENHQHIIDSIVYSKISTGNKKGGNGDPENHLIIEEITFFGKFNVNEKLNIFKTSIKLSDELKIRNLNKNWSYVESNSLNDKRKIQHNLKDIILFYSGIYLVYERKLNKALDILKTLHSKEDSRIQVDKEKNEIIGNQNLISASRLNDILLNLFISSAVNSYDNLNKEQACLSLKECEKMFPNHPLSFEHFICLARFCYDLGEIKNAKEYTLKAKNLNKNKTGIFLNEGFFGALEEDEDKICFNYNELCKVYKHKHSGLNYTEIIGWLNDERKKHDKPFLFDFMIGTLNYFYSDKESGKQTLSKIYNNLEFSNKYPKVYLLNRKVLEEGDTKSTYFKIRSVKSKKKKRTNKRQYLK
jgi:hypothetical protein